MEGSCDPRFGAVREAFAENLAERGDLGAAVAVVLDGRPVVDLWGGWADAARTRPWQRDTLVNVFSAGKAIAALCVLRLAEQGALGIDAPVSWYWPEFAAAGKEGVTVRHVLSHRAGLPAIRREMPAGAMYDWDLMAGALAAEEPWWEPGTAHGYHTNTFGFLVGEIVRRVTCERIGAFLRREVTGPLGADFAFGVNGGDQARVAEFHFTTETMEGSGMDAGIDEQRRFLLARAYWNPPDVAGIGGAVNTPRWRAAEMPSTNGHATACGLARIYGALALGGEMDGVRVLDRATLDEAIDAPPAGPDLLLGRPSRFGLGFQLTQPERPLGPNPRSFGHFGVGGSLGFADLDAGVGFAYTMNRGGPRWRNPRNRALIDALYEAL